MNFYHPEFLYGLIALIIPLIIHLFNFKRFKKVYFTNLAFLRDIQQQSKRHSQWRHLLVMFMRMLFIAAIVLAFAGPYLSNDGEGLKQSDESYVNVFLDNSFSMEARGQEGSLFEEARSEARKIALAYKPSDHFRLLSNEPYSFSRSFVSREVFLEQLQEIEIGKSGISFDKIPQYLIHDDDLKKSSPEQLFLISDFQKKQAFTNHWEVDSNLEISLVPLISASQGNIFIDSVWLEVPLLQPNQIVELHFRLQNQSDVPLEDFPLILKVANSQKSVVSISVDAFASAQSSFVFRTDTAGYYPATIEIQDFPIVYDDQFFCSFFVQETIDVLLISSVKANQDIKTYLESDSVYHADYMEENSIDYGTFSKYSTIILNGLNKYSTGLLIEIQKFVKSGHNVILIPSANSEQAQLNNAYKALSLPQVSAKDTLFRFMKNFDLQSPEFKDIFELNQGQKGLDFNTDLPYFKMHFVLNEMISPLSDVLIEDETNASILIKSLIGEGKVYGFYTPFDNSLSNFSAHAVFVPVLFNLFRQINIDPKLYFFLGQAEDFTLSYFPDNEDGILKMRHWSDSVEFIPQSVFHQGHLNLNFQQSPEQAGIYQLYDHEKLISFLSFNFDRNESFLSYFTKSELAELLKENNWKNVKILDLQNETINQYITTNKDGLQLWKLFILFALGFLIIELFLLRYSK